MSGDWRDLPTAEEWKARLDAKGERRGRYYEAQLTEVYRALLSEGGTAVDGGANRGAHTLPLARAVGPRGRVLAFEPSPKPASLLLETLAREGCEQVDLHLLALAARAGMARFHHYIEADYLSGLRARDDVAGRPSTSFLVATCRLDDVVAPETAVGFVKLDLEGGEFDAMRGARRIMSDHRPVIGFENGLRQSGEFFGYGAEDFFSYFASVGYHVHTAFGDAVSAAQWVRGAGHFQFFAVPAEAGHVVGIIRDAMARVLAGTLEGAARGPDAAPARPPEAPAPRPAPPLPQPSATAEVGPRAAYFRDHMAAELDEMLARHADWRVICDRSYRQSGVFDRLDPSRLTVVEGSAPGWTAGVALGSFQLVAFERDERPAAATIRRSGHGALGVMTELALRRQAFAPARFSGAGIEPTRRKVAILSGARSGSTALALEFRRLGLGSPMEHIQAPLIDFARHRATTAFDFVRWRDTLVAANTLHGVFGTKVIWQLLRDFRGVLDEADQARLDAFVGEFSVVVIDRPDIVAQAVSDYLANVTGIWHRWRRVTDEDYRERLDQARTEVDWAKLMATYRAFVNDREELLAFAEGLAVPPVRVDFDEISADPAEAALRAARALGFDVVAGREVAEAPRLARTHSALHQDLADELRRRLEEPQ